MTTTCAHPSSCSRSHPSRSWRHGVALIGVLALATVAPWAPTDAQAQPTPSPAPAQGETLPLGDADLTETRRTRTVAPGVTLTEIVRGTEPADPDDLLTTTRGPWRVQVLTIDPDRSRGGLTASYGPDLARAETVRQLAEAEGALAAVNAGFFSFTASEVSPGEPVGIGVYDGELLSEPVPGVGPGLLVDGGDDTVSVVDWTWSEVVTGTDTGLAAQLDALNRETLVPEACAGIADQTTCPSEGDTVRFTPEFAASTPAGPGVEVVLDAEDCVVQVRQTRGGALAGDQTSIQATGSDTLRLLAAAGRGCVRTDRALVDEAGEPVELDDDAQVVNGRPELLRDGETVVEPIEDDFNARNPRTLAGTSEDGTVMLVTADGRQPESVGLSITETAAVAGSLGMSDALNLDGGGSTTMVVRDRVVNSPSGGTERAVGDALVYRPRG